jgi:chromate transport protein ChrA
LKNQPILRHAWSENHFGVRIAIIYAVFAAVWILLSDQVLELLVTDAATLSRLQTYKGWFFVAITAGLLYVLVARYAKALSRRDAHRCQLIP